MTEKSTLLKWVNAMISQKITSGELGVWTLNIISGDYDEFNNNSRIFAKFIQTLDELSDRAFFVKEATYLRCILDFYDKSGPYIDMVWYLEKISSALSEFSNNNSKSQYLTIKLASYKVPMFVIDKICSSTGEEILKIADNFRVGVLSNLLVPE